ncbi:RNase H domain-containing protein [Trichonephila clavipes]|nr:RNase H domain-containing protein [Trichonephila clavipes]
MLSRICAHLERAVQKHQITSKEQLKSILQEEWLNIAPETTRHLVESMPRRLEAVISAKGVSFYSNLRPNVNNMSGHPELKQLALEVIDGTPLDAVKIYTDGSKGETNTTGSGVLIEIPGCIIKIQGRNADHASFFRTELIAIMCGLSLINSIQDQAFSKIWTLTDSPSSIQHLSNCLYIGDSTNSSILHVFQQLFERHPIHIGLPRNAAADDLAKVAASYSVDPEDHMILTLTEIYAKAKEFICRTCIVPPVHPWYFQRHPGSTLSFKGSRSY